MIKVIMYTEKTGKYYVNNMWMGNCYLDTLGNIRDTDSGVIICTE